MINLDVNLYPRQLFQAQKIKSLSCNSTFPYILLYKYVYQDRGCHNPQLYSLIPAQPLNPSYSSVICSGVTCPSASAQFVPKPHHTKKEVCSSTICNIPNFLLLKGSHTMAFHAMTLHSTSFLVKTHRSKPFISSPF